MIVIPSNMVLLGGEVQYRSIFTCVGCGAQAAGDIRRCDIHELERQRPTAYAMPVGWSSHYRPAGDGYHCPNCKPL